MNKAELVKMITEETGWTNKVATEALNAVTKSISEALISGQNVQLVGFGSFEIRHRSEREGKNPQTGETIHIEAKKTVAFKAGKYIKEELNA